MSINRREFIKASGVTFACACTGIIGASGCTAGTSSVPAAPAESYRAEDNRLIVDLSQIDALQEPGGACKFYPGLDDVTGLALIVINAGDGGYRAFADRCTHNGKELDLDRETQELVCVSRHSHFDLEGDVLRGNAESALLRYPLRHEGTELVIDL